MQIPTLLIMEYTKKLQNWIFTYNSYKDVWQAVKRENYFDLFNKQQSAAILEAPLFEELLALVEDVEG